MARRAREEIMLELIDMLSNTYEWRLTELQAELAAERKRPGIWKQKSKPMRW